MRYLGIDFGSRRVGIAISDETNSMAFPYAVIQNNEKLIEEIGQMIIKEKITNIIIGESFDYAGTPNKIMKSIKDFASTLEQKTKLTISFEPEFLTSIQAQHLQGKNEMHDASAATIILQSFLDKRKS